LYNEQGYLTQDALKILNGYLTPEAVYTHMNSKKNQCPMKIKGKVDSDTKEEDEKLKMEFQCKECKIYLYYDKKTHRCVNK